MLYHITNPPTIPTCMMFYDIPGSKHELPSARYSFFYDITMTHVLVILMEKQGIYNKMH